MTGGASAGGMSTGAIIAVNVIDMVTIGMAGAGAMLAGGMRASAADVIMIAAISIRLAMLTIVGRAAVNGTDEDTIGETRTTVMDGDRSATNEIKSAAKRRRVFTES
ncbi:hypothetical protein OI69_11300 [Pectobacterium fontis]|uniref:Uncharacterized protein n=1 Tax=Pectobacterium fontis TaxID=2558042 RepID=A0A7V8L5V2_9GAMM|nr:hypothetical protein OI69_11300 [Pectobacterium fontis]